MPVEAPFEALAARNTRCSPWRPTAPSQRDHRHRARTPARHGTLTILRATPSVDAARHGPLPNTNIRTRALAQERH